MHARFGFPSQPVDATHALNLSADEKIRFVSGGLRGKETAAELC